MDVSLRCTINTQGQTIKEWESWLSDVCFFFLKIILSFKAIWYAGLKSKHLCFPLSRVIPWEKMTGILSYRPAGVFAEDTLRLKQGGDKLESHIPTRITHVVNFFMQTVG